MFDSTSRYKNVEVTETTIAGADGLSRKVKYVRRRFAPLSAGLGVSQEHIVHDGDRLDNITALYIGDPTLFWRVCDLNDAMSPFDLTAGVGRRLRITPLIDGENR